MDPIEYMESLDPDEWDEFCNSIGESDDSESDS